MFRRSVDDQFNLNHKRNLRNTNKRHYNCAGYALGTFSWYCPHDEKDEDGNWFGYDYGFESNEEAWRKTMYAVAQMIRDFSNRGLRIINKVDELHGNEYAFAFRLSADGDFHYIKRNLIGQWYHKRGASLDIDRMTTDEVFNTRWCGRYNGPIILMAIQN